MAVAAIDVHRWTRSEYDGMVSAGLFPPDARVELVDGTVYDMTPQNSAHTTSLHLLQEALRAAFPSRYVRVQSPLALDDYSEPEPDLAVVEGSPRDYRDRHPATALLVAEVADTSLAFDRGLKAEVYARAGIPEYWLLNLPDRALEVFREPAEGRYRSHAVLRGEDRVSPLARPEVSFRVADLLP